MGPSGLVATGGTVTGGGAAGPIAPERGLAVEPECKVLLVGCARAVAGGGAEGPSGLVATGGSVASGGVAG